MSTTQAKSDERLVKTSLRTKVMRRPEFGALIGALVIYVMFTFFDQSGTFATLVGTARWTDVASATGMMAIVVALLMIGGEFDLSAGVMVGSSGITLGLLVTKVHMNLYLAIAITIAIGMLIGLLNGYLVTRTKLPSFIVTLATFFVLRGFNLGFTQLWTGTVRVEGLSSSSGYNVVRSALAATFLGSNQFGVDVIWWLGFLLIAWWVLSHSRYGNWIAAVGGDANAARNTGVPVRMTKIALFITVSTMASFVGVMQVIRFDGMQAGQGVGEEFTYIIAAVVGGCLLTGGFGSVIGASIGASIIGIAFIGISYANWNTDWNYAFLGAILFAAVSVNTVIRRRAESASK